MKWTKNPAKPDGPYAEVRRIGRFTYAVIVRDGGLRYGPDGDPWHRMGEQRAKRKAERELNKYRRKRGYLDSSWTLEAR